MTKVNIRTLKLEKKSDIVNLLLYLIIGDMNKIKRYRQEQLAKFPESLVFKI